MCSIQIYNQIIIDLLPTIIFNHYLGRRSQSSFLRSSRHTFDVTYYLNSIRVTLSVTLKL